MELYSSVNNRLSADMAGTITIGGNLTVNRLGLGTNRITDTPDAEALLHRAVELDIQFIDTADVYTGSASETTIGKTLHPYPEGVVIATKGGMIPGGVDASPLHLEEALRASLRRLQLDRIDLYQLHRVDPNVALEESVGFLKQAQANGQIRHIGLSEVTVEQLEVARKVAPIASVQNRYNLLDRQHDEVVEYCEANGIVFIPYRPLGGINNPIQQQTLEAIADRYDAAPEQIGLAWLLQRSKVMLPIPGTLSIKHLEVNVRAASIGLDSESLAALDRITA